MTIQITHLFNHPHHIDAVAQMIYDEFWRDVVDGLSLEFLRTHLHTATDPTRLPLSLIALDGDHLMGTVNLIENDDGKRTHLRPWLAAMVVAADRRGEGIGTRLVRALLVEAERMQFPTLYFGTDGPGFYERIGAMRHEQVTKEFFIMRFDLPRASVDSA